MVSRGRARAERGEVITPLRCPSHRCSITCRQNVRTVACRIEHETGRRGNVPPVVVSWLQEEIESASKDVW